MQEELLGKHVLGGGQRRLPGPCLLIFLSLTQRTIYWWSRFTKPSPLVEAGQRALVYVLKGTL